MCYTPGVSVLVRLRAQQRHLPGKHDQLTHGGKGGFDSRVAGAAAGDAALTAAALKREPTEAELSAIDRYGGDGSYNINRGLRSNGGDPAQLEQQRHRDAVDGMDSVMSSAHLSRDVVVYRKAATQDVFGSAAHGDMTGVTWRDHAFVSTSVVPCSVGGGLAQMRIVVPAGTSAFSHRLLDDDEMVLDRGLTFRIVHDRGGQSGEIRHLDVEVVVS
jgi:ADP-ribosyltransferase exoenzyme